jgi:carboxyl-terminal processing protease
MRLLRVVAGWLLAGSAAFAHAAPERVALLIGNAAYADAPLRNPLNDVREVAASLKSIGFDVTTHENLKLGEMREALRKFVLANRSADVRLIYYAGHGLQLRGRSYLLPVGVRLDNETHVLERTADATELVEQLSAIEHGANVVIIDACRTHPMFNPGSRRMWAARPGLSRLPAPSGTVVAFSTRPGQVARDGDGDVSVYTRHLTRVLKQAPELPVEAFFKRVRAGVVAETQSRQVPWESSDLNGELCFRPDPSGQCMRTP